VKTKPSLVALAVVLALNITGSVNAQDKPNVVKQPKSNRESFVKQTGN
jgi:hypothetical protein